jgi:hypothetical protein
MRGRFLAFFVLICLPLVSIQSSCKKAGEAGVYVITGGEGAIFYDGIAITYDVSFRCTVSNQSEVPGTVTAWRIVFKLGSEGLGETIREINSENCALYNMSQLAGLRIDSHGETTMAGRTVPPIDRREQYFSSIPDNMDISVTITDDHSHQSTVQFNAVIAYSEDIGP